MKSLTDFETGLLESGENIKRGITSVLNNAGRAVALITAAVTALVMFTDIGFIGFETASFVSSLLLLLTSAYIIYFSLEDAGEKLGATTEEYTLCEERYKKAASMIEGTDIEALRSFCEEYSRRELEFRRRSMMLAYGISPKELDAFLSGEKCDKRTERALRRISKLSPASLTPKLLLSGERRSSKNELEDPSRLKLPRLILKLIPSTLCMTVTVSVMLTAKDGMSAADVINAVLKFSSLPIIGFRGYSAGYQYTKQTESAWLSTKAGILEAFIEEKEKR